MKKRLKISSAQVLVLGFFAVILIGTLLLCMPFASKDEPARLVDSFFTATSATCVTGLVTLTTATQWTLFGKIVILIMIQIGGLGFMTFLSLSAIIAKKQLALSKRKLLMQSAGTIELNGIVKHMRRIVFGTFIIEGNGAAILSVCFWIKGDGFFTGLFNGIFHSVSAFCNAGFDILGENSLIDYQNDGVILLTIAVLIIIGGIGFLVWDDFTEHGIKFKKYKLHSKLALTATVILIFFGAAVIYLTERNHALAEMNELEKILNAFFESITLRTAGFASFDQADLSNGGTAVSYLLMLVGGSPGSTAGGIKTVTFAVVIFNAICFARNKESLTAYKKRVHDSIVKQACAIITLYALVVFFMIIIISALEPDFSLADIAFEVISAIATVGLTRGITPILCTASKILLCATMFFGRLGGLTLVLAIAEKRNTVKLERPFEKILIG